MGNLYRFLFAFLVCAHVYFGVISGADITSAAAENAILQMKTIATGQDVEVKADTLEHTLNDGQVHGLHLILNATSTALETILGGKSAQALVDADCTTGRILTRSLTVFEEPDAAGPSHPRPVARNWAAAPAGTYGADVIAAFCRPVTAAAASPISAAVQPTQPVVSQVSKAPTAVASAAAASQVRATSTPAPLPPASAEPIKSDVPGPSATIPEASTHAFANPFVVQLVSAPSEAEAKRLMARLRTRLDIWPADSTAYVVRGEVRGMARYRGRLDGFASRADAVAFCDKVRATDRTCVVFHGKR